MSPAPGTRLGPYEVVAPLGAGGMGEVCLARDTKLDRDVALKTLPREFAAESEWLERLRREARMLAALNHPNIGAIYGLEDSAGTTYLVMELVEGETLAERLARTGPLPLDEVLRIGASVAEALEAAHARGITHRDVKPANIKVTPEGRVKVLDFGLAKAARRGPDADTTAPVTMPQSTEAGVVLGTPAYMSPEQARGLPVDRRTDVWAFGCLLYELLSGRRAFAGATAPDVIGAVLTQEPDWRALPAATPERIRRLVRRCLEKTADRRPSSISEARTEIELARAGRRGVSRRTLVAATAVTLAVAVGLPVALDVGGVRDRLAGTGTGPRIHSIAVLPLRNASGDPTQDYFADGMTESLIEGLAKIGSIKVIARTSAMRYKNTETPLPDIARQLNVDAVVEGSAARVGNRVHIVASLVDPPTQTTLWTEDYDRASADVLILENEIARTIARQIHVRLTPEEDRRLAAAHRVDPEAHDLYIRGWSHLTRLTPPELDTAMQYFEEVRTKEPALGWAGIAAVWEARQDFGFLPSGEAGPRAKAAALEALKRDDTLYEVHLVLAVVSMRVDWDWERARREFERALDLNPNDAQAYAQYARFEAIQGEFARAVELGARAVELDPLRPVFRAMQGLNLIDAGRDEEALPLLQNARRQQPGLDLTGIQAMAFHGLRRNRDLYHAWRTSFDAHHAAEVVQRMDRGYTQGGYQVAMRAAADALAARRRKVWTDPAPIVQMYAEAGDWNEVVAWLEASLARHDAGLPGLTVDPELAALHGDARFQSIRQRMQLPPL